MDGTHNPTNDYAEERITLEDLLLVEDCYYGMDAEDHVNDDRHDQEMLEANNMPKCEVFIEKWPIEDDEGNTVDSDQEVLNYDELETSEESEEEAQQSNATEDWKNNYEAWLSGYKIPKVQSHDREREVQRRNPVDEACGSGRERRSEGSCKRSNDANGRNRKT